MNSNSSLQLDIKKTSSATIANLLSRYKFNYHNEIQLQDGIEKIFLLHKMPYKRELHISRKERPDFLLSDGIAIEVKVQGSRSQFLRQASRYLLDPKITELILVGTPHWMHSIPNELHNKPIHTVRLLGSML